MKVLLIAVVVVLQVTGCFGFDPKCPFPPSLWCSSYDVARTCKVTEQCLRTVWSPLPRAAPLVNFTLYYESLCPDCQDFIKTQLYPAFQAVGSIFNLTLVPYGNAREKKVGDKWEFDCQHGEQECIGNMLDIYADDTPTKASTNAAPVNVVVYYEAMCPYCRVFITTQLYPVFKAVSSSVLNITLVPFGIAWERQHNGNWQFACQHGPIECLGNQIATCALNLTSNDPDLYMPFINCMELNTEQGQEMAALNKCTGPNNVSERDIVSCLRSPEGLELQHQMALITQNILIQYTPLIVINGVHNIPLHQQAYDNLLKLVCHTYKGPQPDVCHDMTNAPVLG